MNNSIDVRAVLIMTRFKRFTVGNGAVVWARSYLDVIEWVEAARRCATDLTQLFGACPTEIHNDPCSIHQTGYEPFGKEDLIIFTRQD